MDETLRKVLRDLESSADPAAFLAAGRVLERAGASRELFSDLLDRVLFFYDALYVRGDEQNRNTFEIAWSLKEQYRRCLNVTIYNGGVLAIHHDHTERPEINVSLSQNTFSNLLHLIVQHRRLSPSTPRFLQALCDEIEKNGIVSYEAVPVSYEELAEARPRSPARGRVRYLFDVVARIYPQKTWQPTHRLRFEFVRAVFRDLLEVSIEDNLYWGTEHEVQGMRITGTSYTMYNGVDPEYDYDLGETIEDPDHPYSTYEIIDNIDELPALITEIFNRFRQI